MKEYDKFIDYCEECKKEVEITWHPGMTCPGTCANGHCWFHGKKYKAVPVIKKKKKVIEIEEAIVELKKI